MRTIRPAPDTVWRQGVGRQQYKQGQPRADHCGSEGSGRWDAESEGVALSRDLLWRVLPVEGR